MLQDQEKLAAVLDRHQPGWAVQWASQSDLRELALGNIKIERLKERVAYDLFYPILNAALAAGLIAEVPAQR